MNWANRPILPPSIVDAVDIVLLSEQLREVGGYPKQPAKAYRAASRKQARPRVVGELAGSLGGDTFLKEAPVFGVGGAHPAGWGNDQKEYQGDPIPA